MTVRYCIGYKKVTVVMWFEIVLFHIEHFINVTVPQKTKLVQKLFSVLFFMET